MTGHDRSNESDSEVRLNTRDVGGISEAAVTLREGVTIISGANASNKSSLLRSLSGVLGGPVPPIKSDAKRGSVRMAVDGTEYYLDLGREGGETVVTGADRYSSARDLCELFVALTETNPVRRAVQSGTGLYDLLMRPVDTAEIEAGIRRLSEEKADLDDRLATLEAMEARLPGLEARHNALRDDLADVEEALRETRDAVEKLEAETDEADDRAATTDLDAKRAERTSLRERIGTHENAIESLREEIDSVEGQLADPDTVEVDGTVPDLESELEQLHYRKQQLTSTINALSPLVEMNEKLLEGAVPEAMTSGDVVADLDPESKSINCWTCGSTVERARIDEQTDAVQDLLREKRNRRDTIAGRIQFLTEQKRELEQRRDEREQLRDRRVDLVEEIEEREQSLASLRGDLRRLEGEIEDLQRRVETDTDQLAEYYDEISDLEYERGQLTSELEAVESKIDGIESELSDRADLEERREEVATELDRKRERITSLERDLVSTFNQEMQAVLDTLEYRSIERVWLERRSTDRSDTEFELHVVRENEDGHAYDETVDNLSKSERSVIGLVVALAGYLVHDVGETVPFVVVDAVEMFDTDRIRGLMEHFDAHATYVVATVLPEDGDRLEGLYQTIPTSTIAADT